MTPSELEPGPGEELVDVQEIDTSGVTLDEETTPVPPKTETRASLSEKEAINDELVKALRENLPNPVFPILVVRIFNFGGAVYDAGLDAHMPPAHRLVIGGAVLALVIGATNPDVLDSIAGKWKSILKPRQGTQALAAEARPEVAADAA